MDPLLEKLHLLPVIGRVVGTTLEVVFTAFKLDKMTFRGISEEYKDWAPSALVILGGLGFVLVTTRRNEVAFFFASELNLGNAVVRITS